MCSTVLRCRVVSILSKNGTNSRFLSSDVSSSGASPPTPAAPASNAGAAKKSWKFLQYGLIGSLTGATAALGYATYAYSSDEIHEKTKAIRAAANHTVGEDASAVDQVEGAIYSTAMSVFAKAIDLYLDLRRQIEEHVQTFAEPTSTKLLPDLHPTEQHVFTLVLDLSETLICTDWTRERGWHTFKRPGVDAFLEQLSKFYEIVIYSDQLNMYIDPIVDRLDQKQSIRYRLSRDATWYQDGKHYRDLSKLNRDPAKVMYVSGHALESCLQTENCIPIKPWKLEADDTALVDLIPFLEFVARHPPADIRETLKSYDRNDIGKQFIERFKEHQGRTKKQKQRFWRK